MELLIGDNHFWGVYSYWPISQQIEVMSLCGISAQPCDCNMVDKVKKILPELRRHSTLFSILSGRENKTTCLLPSIGIWVESRAEY